MGDELRAKRTAAAVACNAIVATADVEYRSIASITHTAGTKSVYGVAALTSKDITGCTSKVFRTVIVVDSMPDAMDRDGAGANIDMQIDGPQGACSVREAVRERTKVTYAPAAVAVTAHQGSACAMKGTVAKHVRPKLCLFKSRTQVISFVLQ